MNKCVLIFTTIVLLEVYNDESPAETPKPKPQPNKLYHIILLINISHM